MASSGTFVRAGRRLLWALPLALVALLAAVPAVTARQYFAGTVQLPGFPANKKFLSEATNLDPVYRAPFRDQN